MWEKLEAVVHELDQVADLSFNAVQPRKLRAALAEMQEQLRQFPPAMRTYPPVIHRATQVKEYLRVIRGLLPLGDHRVGTPPPPHGGRGCVGGEPEWVCTP